MKEVTAYRCEFCYKLYRRTAKMLDNMEDVLQDNDYSPMPTPTGGCANYEYEEFF